MNLYLIFLIEEKDFLKTKLEKITENNGRWKRLAQGWFQGGDYILFYYYFFLKTLKCLYQLAWY